MIRSVNYKVVAPINRGPEQLLKVVAFWWLEIFMKGIVHWYYGYIKKYVIPLLLSFSGKEPLYIHDFQAFNEAFNNLSSILIRKDCIDLSMNCAIYNMKMLSPCWGRLECIQPREPNLCNSGYHLDWPKQAQQTYKLSRSLPERELEIEALICAPLPLPLEGPRRFKARGHEVQCRSKPRGEFSPEEG